MTIPRKRFGQNFLKDASVIDRILSSIAATDEQQLIEIGPGHGALTEGLARTGCELTLIEVDHDLSAALRRAFPDANLIGQDVLTVNFSDLGAGPFRVVGNLPYNISTPLMFKLFADRERFVDMHFMLQLEVVDRMTATPSTRAYGRLSVMTQLYCEAEKLFEVPPEAFSPRPKVRSAIVRLRSRIEAVDKPDMLEQVLIKAFSARRKTVRNALKTLLNSDELEELGIDPTVRPENLHPDQFMACAKHLQTRAP